MKKVVYASMLAVGAFLSFGAQAVTICDAAKLGGKSGAGVAPASGTAGTNFMVRAITPNCSANVNMDGQDGTSGAWFAVGAASVKGANTFAGHTNGGAVSPSAKCAVPGGCTLGEATTAMGVANTAAQNAGGTGTGTGTGT
ncbi:hypothetical protein [Rhodocyclus tenuis]|uniref:Uncharacterized protein n=2 Tax=Rhodocyclus tenuis TaxID=1066 RepID=A0A840G383_RHOTE|nr:hypothetical protein [Rhodocyclus tenuis]MBB4246863.1 hypothetical protein [Rhodocyclus tenuis]